MTSYERAFSKNIRNYRKKFGLTQRQLAEATGYSEKTVSKWEIEGCVPPIDSLFRIASFFHIDLNALFVSDETVHYLGIDGGGTRTVFALTDATGRTIRQLRLGPCNPFDIGIDRAKAVLQDGITQICDGIPLSTIVLFAGVAGGKVGVYADAFDSFFRDFHFAAADTGSDNDNIIAVGLSGREGITMILSTGICSFVVRGGQYHRISGWGYLFDEGGSGFNIGRDALSAYFSACDGSGKETALSRRIDEMSGGDPDSLLNTLYEGGKREIAAYATLVFQEAEKGDDAAVSILRRNMAEASKIIRAARSYFPDDAMIPVVLAGGLTRQPLLLPFLKEALGDLSGIALEVLTVPSIQGAIQKAMELWKRESSHPSDD